MRGFRLRLSMRVKGVRTAVAAFGPAVAGRGIAQLSAFLDLFLAGMLKVGALASLSYMLMLYLLPVSLFGLSVAAAELPELARLRGGDGRPFLARLRASLRQSMVLTIPTAVGYLSVGFLIVAGLYRRGAFGLEENWLVWAVLGAYSLGLVATTMSRLLQNAFWALGDTKTPARVAVVRVVLSAAVAVPVMFLLDRWAVAAAFGLAPDDSPLFLGAVGLGLGSAVASWVELGRLCSALKRRVAGFALPWRSLITMAALALAAAAGSLGLWWLLPAWPPLISMGVVVGFFALTYLGAAAALKLPALDAWAGRIGVRRERVR